MRTAFVYLFIHISKTSVTLFCELEMLLLLAIHVSGRTNMDVTD